MKKIAMVVFVAMVIASCAKEEKSESAELEQITLSATFSTSPSAEIKPEHKPEHQTESRATATAFEANDELGLFVVKSGMEVQSKDNLVNNHKMVVGNDGVIKGTPTAVYYPTSSSQTPSPTSQVTIHSYYPYQSGNATADALGVLVGIRTDQTDFLDVKRSDLCYGSARDIVPTKVAQPITFRHSFAQLRINVTLYNGCPAIKQLRLINVKDSATLNMQTGSISLKNHTAEVLAYKSAENSYSTIIPAQTLNGACIAIDLVDNKTTYIYNAINPIDLTQSATNTLNLAINDKGVASLSGTPSVTAWTTATSSGTMNSAINNQISLYWLAPHSDYATADKITLSTTDPLGVTRDIDLTPTLDPTSSSSYAIYKLNLSLSGATYPLVVNKIRVYKGATLLRDCLPSAMIGSAITKSGTHSMSIYLSMYITPIEDWLNVSGYGESRTLTITTANNAEWKATANGTGLSVYPTSGKSGETATINWLGNVGVNVVPTNRIGTVTIQTVPAGVTAIINTTQVGAMEQTVKLNGLNWAKGNLVAVGPNNARVGAPTDAGLYFHFGSLIGWSGGASGDGTGWGQPGLSQRVKPSGYSGSTGWPAGYTTSGNVPTSGNASTGVGDPCRYYLGGSWRLPTNTEFQALNNAGTTWGVNGRWFGPSPGNVATSVFFPVSGIRGSYNGSFAYVGSDGYYWSSVQYNSSYGYYLYFHNSGVNPLYNSYRDYGYPVRCVSN